MHLHNYSHAGLSRLPPALSFPALSIAPNHSLCLGLLSGVVGLGI